MNDSAFSNFIVYVDESGDHGLESIDPTYPVFVLAFCIFRKEEYIDVAVPALQLLKFDHFGHDQVVLHEREIRKAKAPFQFLQVPERRCRFLADVSRSRTSWRDPSAGTSSTPTRRIAPTMWSKPSSTAWRGSFAATD